MKHVNTSEQIKQTHSYLYSKVLHYQEQIAALQKICPHTNVRTMFNSNTGNWDSRDYYWVVVECKDCCNIRRFDSEEHPEQYRSYS